MTDSNPKRHCSVPWPIQDWFESRYGNICERHDNRYWEIKRGNFYFKGYARYMADRALRSEMLELNPGYLGVVIAWVSYFFIRALGWVSLYDLDRKLGIRK